MAKLTTIEGLFEASGITTGPPEAAGTLADLVSLQRLPLLAHLKAVGLPLAQRQKVANTLACAMREGRVAVGHEQLHPTGHTSRHKAAPPAGIESISLASGQHCRVFAQSDVHADAPANFEWIKSKLPARSHGAFDVCLLAGDLSDNDERLREALAVLKARFDEVIFAAGNHELWLRPKPLQKLTGPDGRTSLDRLAEVHQVCAEVGVRTSPLWVVCGEERDVLLAPLNSWYHESWDREPELPNSDENGMEIWTDMHLCKWPPHLPNASLALAEHFAQLNETSLLQLTASLPPAPPAGRPQPSTVLDKVGTYALFKQKPYTTGALWTSVEPATFFTPRTSPRPTQRLGGEAQPQGSSGESPLQSRPFVVSLSHMVPRQELIPEKRMLLFPSLHRVAGSDPLEAQIRRLMPDVHLFGHTHLNMDLTLDGVRYVQWPLGSAGESTWRLACKWSGANLTSASASRECAGNVGEQRAQTRLSSMGMMCVYDGGGGGEAPQHWTHWGRHYEEFERDLTKVGRPPYITGRANAASLRAVVHQNGRAVQ